MEYSENNIEFYSNTETATASFTQGRYKTKIRKLAEKFPEVCKILAENDDGSILAHFPVSWVKINPPRKVSEERKKEFAERMKKTRESSEFKQKSHQRIVLKI